MAALSQFPRFFQILNLEGDANGEVSPFILVINRIPTAFPRKGELPDKHIIAVKSILHGTRSITVRYTDLSQSHIREMAYVQLSVCATTALPNILPGK